jgi:hypothetical protein
LVRCCGLYRTWLYPALEKLLPAAYKWAKAHLWHCHAQLVALPTGATACCRLPHAALWHATAHYCALF